MGISTLICAEKIEVNLIYVFSQFSIIRICNFWIDDFWYFVLFLFFFVVLPVRFRYFVLFLFFFRGFTCFWVYRSYQLPRKRHRSFPSFSFGPTQKARYMYKTITTMKCRFGESNLGLFDTGFENYVLTIFPNLQRECIAVRQYIFLF